MQGSQCHVRICSLHPSQILWNHSQAQMNGKQLFRDLVSMDPLSEGRLAVLCFYCYGEGLLRRHIPEQIPSAAQYLPQGIH